MLIIKIGHLLVPLTGLYPKAEFRVIQWNVCDPLEEPILNSTLVIILHFLPTLNIWQLGHLSSLQHWDRLKNVIKIRQRLLIFNLFVIKVNWWKNDNIVSWSLPHNIFALVIIYPRLKTTYKQTNFYSLLVINPISPQGFISVTHGTNGFHLTCVFTYAQKWSRWWSISSHHHKTSIKY